LNKEQGILNVEGLNRETAGALEQMNIEQETRNGE
jgi:hypothetical protein